LGWFRFMSQTHQDLRLAVSKMIRREQRNQRAVPTSESPIKIGPIIWWDSDFSKICISSLHPLFLWPGGTSSSSGTRIEGGRVVDWSTWPDIYPCFGSPLRDSATNLRSEFCFLFLYMFCNVIRSHPPLASAGGETNGKGHALRGSFYWCHNNRRNCLFFSRNQELTSTCQVVHLSCHLLFEVFQADRLSNLQCRHWRSPVPPGPD